MSKDSQEWRALSSAGERERHDNLCLDRQGEDEELRGGAGGVHLGLRTAPRAVDRIRFLEMRARYGAAQRRWWGAALGRVLTRRPGLSTAFGIVQ